MSDAATGKEAPSVQIARLHDFMAALAQPNPFGPGDLVTPRLGANLRAVGEPHLVLATFAPITNVGFDVGSPAFAKNYDMRVACVNRGFVCAYLAWSGDHEPYEEPAHA